MAESNLLITHVQQRIDAFLDGQATTFAEIGTDVQPLLDRSRELLAGGKRFRARFCYWGWQSITGIPDPIDPLPVDPADPDAAIGVASALELFHAAALVHDDIIDNSDTRRGAPSAHRTFEAMHLTERWSGSAAPFGRASAILLGDLLLGWSDELLDQSIATLDPARARAARREFNGMRTEVTLGQYLDVLEEQAWSSSPETELLRRAHRVIVFKSAKYSVERPLRIGAALAGASAAQLEALSDYGLPLGIAYQLRDDLLGVYGDSEVTGKPAGDDLREGKRTVLIAMARQSLPRNARELLDELLGDPELDAEQISILQSTITESGATDRIEQLISKNVGSAKSALQDAPISGGSRDELFRLADQVSRRSY